MIIVTGYPRSGTSLMMRMLEEAGVEIYCDEDQRGKSYETSQAMRLPDETDWLDDVTGAVKVLHPTVYTPPEGHTYIHMTRGPREQALSAIKMIERSGQVNLTPFDTAVERLSALTDEARVLLASMGTVVEVRFEDLVVGSVAPVADLLDLDIEAMRSVIIPRRDNCYPGFLEKTYLH